MQEWLDALEQAGYNFPAIPDKLGVENRGSRGMVKGQPISTTPRYNLGGPGGDMTYREFLRAYHPTTGGNVSSWADWLKGTTKPLENRPPKRVLKMVLMTKDEWPLIQEWTLYHGEIVGFENLYILDGSDDPVCIEFLMRARDDWGANVVFTKANLNQLNDLVDVVFGDIAASSDIMMKVDTDEFLAVMKSDPSCRSGSTSSSDCTLSPYGVAEYINSNEFVLDGRLMKVGFRSGSVPSREACSSNNDRRAIEAVPMLTYTGTHPTDYKSFYDARTFDHGDLGSHYGYALPPFDKPDFVTTRLGIIHAHARCIETEVANCRKALISHGFIGETDTTKVALRKLQRKIIGKGRDVCAMTAPEDMQRPRASSHKVLFYAKYLSCKEASMAAYYAIPPQRTNLDLQEFFGQLKDKYGVVSW